MKIYTYTALENFEPWAGAKSTWNKLYNEGLLGDLEAVLEDLYPDGLEETQLNDILWFEEDWCYETVGLKTYTELTEEIDSVKERMEEIMEDYNHEIEMYEEEDGSLLDSDKEEIWNVSYKEEYEALQEELRELKGEEETYL